MAGARLLAAQTQATLWARLTPTRQQRFEAAQPANQGGISPGGASLGIPLALTREGNRGTGLGEEKVCPSARAGGFLLLQEPPYPVGLPGEFPVQTSPSTQAQPQRCSCHPHAPAKPGPGRSCLEPLRQIAQEINSHLPGTRKAINCPSRHQIDGSSPPRVQGGRRAVREAPRAALQAICSRIPLLGTATRGAHPWGSHVHGGRTPAGDAHPRGTHTRSLSITAPSRKHQQAPIQRACHQNQRQSAVSGCRGRQKEERKSSRAGKSRRAGDAPARHTAMHRAGAALLLHALGAVFPASRSLPPVSCH